MTSEEQLEQLRKALERAVATASIRQPWHEHFDRSTSAPGDKTVQAADIIQGLSGSWASSYSFGWGAGASPDVTNTARLDTSTPTPIREKQTKLGQPGFSDVDFVPYNWRTNRFTTKGPTLVGHPISFEVVGPTLKSPFCNWSWEVKEGAGPNGGDLLLIDLLPDGSMPESFNIETIYNIPTFTIGGGTEPNGGLYVIISSDGSNPGSIPSGGTGMDALATHVDTARFEIFRVASVAGGYTNPHGGTRHGIELHPNKSLGDYFDLPAASSRYIRGITIVKPYVTRLAAVPSSGPAVGREQTFVFMSPEVAAQPDNYPPYNTGTPGDGSWMQGGFDAAGTGLSGDTDAYGGKAVLPVPTPIRQCSGRVEKNPGAPTTSVGLWKLENVQNGSLNDVGRVIRIYHVDSDDADTLDYGTVISCLGWFEVDDVSGMGADYTLRRVAEVDPTTGQPFFGPGPYHQEPGSPNINVFFTVHEPVSNLWDGAFDIDGVQVTRIKPIIDPRDVEPSDKMVSDPTGFPESAGSSPSRGDRAIFNTRTFSTGGPILEADNPGSLLDLGFRIVFYPAKDDGGGDPIPDFDNPILGRELTIDPLVTDELQYLTIDYSAGTVKLSHAPPTSSDGDIVPNGIIGGAGTTNPRSEIVLFAACVPYSFEPCQLGTGIRVTERAVPDSVEEDIDVFSGRISSDIDFVNTSVGASTPFFTADVALSDLIQVPETGFFDVLDAAQGTESRGTWGYSSIRVQNLGSGNVTVLEGIYASPGVTDPTGGQVVVIRRDVFFGQASADNSATIDDVRFDTVYGSQKRGCVLRFVGGTCTMQVDGSILVDARGGIDVYDEGSPVVYQAKILNFIGGGVTATPGGIPGSADITFTRVDVQDEGTPVQTDTSFINFIGENVLASVNGDGADVDVWDDWVHIDTVIVTGASANSIFFGPTLLGPYVDSENDGIYCVIGKILFEEVADLHVRPGGFDVDLEVEHVYFDPLVPSSFPLTATAPGFIIAPGSDVGMAEASGSLDCFLVWFFHPKKAVGGASGARADCRYGVGLNVWVRDSEERFLVGFGIVANRWDQPVPALFNFLEFEPSVGTFLQGSILSLYKIRTDKGIGGGGTS